MDESSREKSGSWLSKITGRFMHKEKPTFPSQAVRKPDKEPVSTQAVAMPEPGPSVRPMTLDEKVDTGVKVLADESLPEDQFKQVAREVAQDTETRDKKIATKKMQKVAGVALATAVAVGGVAVAPKIGTVFSNSAPSIAQGIDRTAAEPIDSLAAKSAADNKAYTAPSGTPEPLQNNHPTQIENPVPSADSK